MGLSPIAAVLVAAVACAVLAWLLARAVARRRPPVGDEPLFQQAATGMLLVGLDGAVLRANPAACALLGASEAELAGRPWAELLAPEDRERTGRLVETLAGPDTPGWRQAARLVTAAGAPLLAGLAAWLARDQRGRARHAVVQVTPAAHDLDIGARNALEAQVQAERDLSDRLLANLSQLGAGVTVVEGGRLVFVNDAFSNLVGYSSEELLAMPDTSAIVVENYRADLAAKHQQVAADDEGAGVYETALRHRDGHIVAVEIASRIMRQQAGGQRISLVRDISDRVRWERSLTEHTRAVATINEELREANQVKSDLVAMLSHDLGQPLTVISGYLDVLAEDWATLDDGQRQDMIAKVSGAATRIRTLVGDILTMSRLEAGALQANQVPVPAGDAVAEVMAGLAGTVPGLATGELTGAAVLADPSQLHQVLVNLVTNAAKYGAPPVQLSATAGDGWVELRVRDHGDGVPEDFVPRLFERFTRAGGEGASGTGLGLFIVKRLVEANGGRIWYERAEPAGACFVVRLPQPEPVALRSG